MKVTQISLLGLHCMQLLRVAKRPLLQHHPTLEQTANPRFGFPSLQIQQRSLKLVATSGPNVNLGKALFVKAIWGCLVYFLPYSSCVVVYTRSPNTLRPCYQQWHHKDVLASFKQSTDCDHQSLHCIHDREHEIEPVTGYEQWTALACASRLIKQALYPAAMRTIDGS